MGHPVSPVSPLDHREAATPAEDADLPLPLYFSYIIYQVFSSIFPRRFR